MSELPVAAENRVAAPEERRIGRKGRVYVNRNLRLPSLGAIGFDLDHTLAHYAPIPVETLAFDVTKKKLVERKGIPPSSWITSTTPASSSGAWSSTRRRSRPGSARAFWTRSSETAGSARTLA